MNGLKDEGRVPVSYTHLRAHETREDLVCRLLLEKKKRDKTTTWWKRTNQAVKLCCSSCQLSCWTSGRDEDCKCKCRRVRENVSRECFMSKTPQAPVNSHKRTPVTLPVANRTTTPEAQVYNFSMTKQLVTPERGLFPRPWVRSQKPIVDFECLIGRLALFKRQ